MERSFHRKQIMAHSLVAFVIIDVFLDAKFPWQGQWLKFTEIEDLYTDKKVLGTSL